VPSGPSQPDVAAPIEVIDRVPTLAVHLSHHDFQGDTTNVAVKIRLKRLGKVRVPSYRIVVVDSRKKRDGKVLEEIGLYRPKEEPSYIEVESERAQYWLGVGAQPSVAVANILEVTGDWQKFKGIEGAEGTLKVKEPKRDKLEIFNEALKEAGNEPAAEAVTAKKKAKAEKRTDAQTPLEEAEARTPADETPEGAETVAEEAQAAEKPESPDRPDADKRES
jgi:small subunit ribosomal protein S16